MPKGVDIKKLAKVFGLLLCLALIFSFAGCGTPKDTAAPRTPTITKTTLGNDNTPTFEFSATDSGSGIDFYLVNIDGAAWTNVGDVTTYTLNTALSEGSHTFSVKAVDKAGNVGDEGSITFTCDIAPPTISSVGASDMTTSSAAISWTTDEGATSQVEYGTTASYGSSSPLQSSLVTSHTVNLTGLTPGTTYHYRVKSKDAAGNEATSGDNTFSVCASYGGPTISNVAVSEVTLTSAKITWTTDSLSTSQVEYGLTYDLGMTTTLNVSLVTTHSVALGGLSQGTFYYYLVKSKDPCGNEGSSTSATFFTTMQQNLAVGESASNAEKRVTVKSAVRVNHYDWSSSGYNYTEYPDSGKIFIIFDALVESIGSASFYASIADFSISDGQGYKYEYDWAYYADDEFNSVELYPGQKTGGKILFEVPIGATGLKLAYDFGTYGTPILATWLMPSA